MTNDPIQRRHLKNLARLRRMNKALSVWDDWDAADLMPPSLRPAVVPPMLDREQLKSLRTIVVDELAELDLLYGKDSLTQERPTTPRWTCDGAQRHRPDCRRYAAARTGP
jgi:hypothetical protein